MPELPEVEQVRRFLEHVLITPKPRKIKSVHIYYPNLIKETDSNLFAKMLHEQLFHAINRIGKYLLLETKDWCIISHLRMEGKYSLHPKPYIPLKHDHVIFFLNDGNCLVYNDARRFSHMHIVPRGESHHILDKLGPEVTELDFKYFLEICKKREKSIKSVLLDQEIVTGIGNIYADEILFASGIHPERKTKELNEEEIKKLVKNSKQIIEMAIEGKGTTIRSFSVNNEEGEFQSKLAVYGKVGKECVKCNGIILKIKVCGRGTSFCPQCQV